MIENVALFHVYICILFPVTCAKSCFTIHITIQIEDDEVIYLKHSAHPLEAVLFAGVWPLLCHNHYPLIIKHCD